MYRLKGELLRQLRCPDGVFSAKILLKPAGALLGPTRYASSAGLRRRRRPLRYTAITGGVQSISATNKACRSAMTWVGGRPPGRRYTIPVSGSPRCIARVPKSASCVSTKRSMACARAKIWLSVNAPQPSSRAERTSTPEDVSHVLGPLRWLVQTHTD